MLIKILLESLILLSLSGVISEQRWGVTYTPGSICALKGSAVDMRCTYSYPLHLKVQKTFWFIKGWREIWEPKDLSQDPEYSHRVEYLGNQNSDCTYRINQLRESDSETYKFRILTNYNKYTGEPGVTLTVTDLQLMMSPDSVTERQSVMLTCRTTCTLTGSPAFIWYRDGSPLSFTGQTHQFTASKGDAGSYTCAVRGYEHLPSPAVALNVRYPPKGTSVSVSPSGEVVGGGSVTLTCSSDANPPVQRYAFIKNRYSSSPEQNDDRSSYIIERTTYRDAGEYYCRAENFLGTDRSPPINLKVLCLKVEINPDSAREGEMVTLTCKNTCTSARTFTFYRDGQVLSNMIDNQFISRSDNAGYYSCRAIYNKDLSSNVVLLRVKYPPKSTSVSVSPSGDVVEGSSVTLTCSSDANPPVQRYTWFKDHKALSLETGAPEDSYTIKSITLQDAGGYICQAGNGIGTNRSPPKRLEVQYSPRKISVSVSPSGEIVEGSSVTLTCSSDANPPVQRYAWFKDNRAVFLERGAPADSYTIKSITQQDAGGYICQAGNGIGTNRSPPEHLEVQYPPKSSSVSVSPSAHVVEGSLVTLTCRSDANPPVQRYTWFKDNGALASWTGPGSSHTITDILPEDSGLYYCGAQNQHGTQYTAAAVTLDVQYPSRNTSVSVSPSADVVKGSSVTLTCSSDANPPVQRYAWFKKNDTGVWQAGSGKILNVSNFKSWNGGQYYCESKNRHGAQNASALQITVQGDQSLITAAAVGTAAILALVCLGAVWVRYRRRKSSNETGHTEGDRQGNSSPIYGNVSGTAMRRTVTQGTDRDDHGDPFYSSIPPANMRTRDRVLYSTVQPPDLQREDSVQYASINLGPPSAAPRSAVRGTEDSCIIYSTVSNRNA